MGGSTSAPPGATAAAAWPCSIHKHGCSPAASSPMAWPATSWPAIEPAGHRLKLLYGVEQSRYGRGAGSPRPASSIRGPAPSSRTVRQGLGPWRCARQADSSPAAATSNRSPISADRPRRTAFRRQDLFRCGAQGLVIFSSEPRPAPGRRNWPSAWLSIPTPSCWPRPGRPK